MTMKWIYGWTFFVGEEWMWMGRPFQVYFCAYEKLAFRKYDKMRCGLGLLYRDWMEWFFAVLIARLAIVDFP